jgi:hypothetical protein
LRIVDESVDVFAETVSAVDHQSGTASKYPIRNRLSVRPEAV